MAPVMASVQAFISFSMKPRIQQEMVCWLEKQQFAKASSCWAEKTFCCWCCEIEIEVERAHSSWAKFVLTINKINIVKHLGWNLGKANFFLIGLNTIYGSKAHAELKNIWKLRRLEYKKFKVPIKAIAWQRLKQAQSSKNICLYQLWIELK